MSRTKKILLALLIVFFIFILFQYIRFPLSDLLYSDCDYENYAWGAYRNSCTCLGIKIASNPPAGTRDAGTGSGCVGLVISKECFEGEDSSGPWKKVPCN